MANVNGVTWGSVWLSIFGRTVEGITKISYKTKTTMTNNYGRGGKPYNYGVGNEEYEGSIEIYVEELNALLEAGKKQFNRPIKLHELPLTTATVLIDENDRTVVDEVTFKFKNTDREFSQGDTSAKVTCELHITDIKYNVG